MKIKSYRAVTKKFGPGQARVRARVHVGGTHYLLLALARI